MLFLLTRNLNIGFFNIYFKLIIPKLKILNILFLRFQTFRKSRKKKLEECKNYRKLVGSCLQSVMMVFKFFEPKVVVFR